MSDKMNSEFRTSRGYQILNRQEKKLTSAMEDYLEMIYRLCLKNGYTRVGRLSELLHVRPSSASKMISKLADMDCIKYERHEIILLTDSGKKIGSYLLCRHNIVEEFLQLIGSNNVLEETELIEHSLIPYTVENLNTFLEFFKSDLYADKNFRDFKKSKERMNT